MNKRIFSRIVALLVVASAAFAGLISPASLLDLEKNADLILMGSASGILRPGAPATFSLQVSRVLKGDPTLAGSAIAVYWTNGIPPMLAGAPMAAAGAGLWFLQHSSGAWRLLPVVQGSVPLSMTFFPAPSSPILSAYVYDSAAPLLDKIASELCSAMERANGDFILQLDTLQDGLLDQLDSPVIALFYQRMSNSNSTQQRIVGLSGLVRRGSAIALAASVQDASAFGAYPKENGSLLRSIREHFRATDASSIAALGQAAVDSTNPISAFREAAAHALAAIHTLATLPYLATFLDDADADLRIEAIGGLGAFANGLPTQTAAGVPSLAYLQLPPTAPYRSADTIANFALGSQAIARNEASYLSFWKQWWLQNRMSLGF